MKGLCNAVAVCEDLLNIVEVCSIRDSQGIHDLRVWGAMALRALRAPSLQSTVSDYTRTQCQGCVCGVLGGQKSFGCRGSVVEVGQRSWTVEGWLRDVVVASLVGSNCRCNEVILTAQED